MFTGQIKLPHYTCRMQCFKDSPVGASPGLWSLQAVCQHYPPKSWPHLRVFLPFKPLKHIRAVLPHICGHLNHPSSFLHYKEAAREENFQPTSGFTKQLAKNNIRNPDIQATVEEICRFKRSRVRSSVACCCLLAESGQWTAGWPPILHLNTVIEILAFHHHVAFFSSSHRPSLGSLHSFQACITSLHTCCGLFTFTVEQSMWAVANTFLSIFSISFVQKSLPFF